MSHAVTKNDDPLARSAQYVKGVGPRRFELLQRLGIETVGDLLFNLPRRYEDLTDCRKISDLEDGKVQTVAGEVVELSGRYTKTGKELLSVVISDKSGVLEGTWFNQPHMARLFRYGQQVAFSGRVTRYQDRWQINNPKVQFLDTAQPGQSLGSVLPIYGLTEGLTNEYLKRLERHVVESYAHWTPEIVPQDLLKRRGLSSAAAAVRDIHMPKRLTDALAARRRMAYEELLVLQLALAHKRRDRQNRQRAPQLRCTRTIDERIRRLLPFTLTKDQDRAIAEICGDLARDRPMQRLLQADVGAGKTAVAIYALLVAVANQHQAALMTPTEVLARQHWRTLDGYLAHSRVRMRLLTGSLSARQRKVALGEIRMGAVDLVVGTQALIQEAVEFNKLGLVVIDEQHRFGVRQRAEIRMRGEDPHYLVMTATPIPRTIALTVFGDLDVSVIRELPPGRQPVRTHLLTEKQRPKLETYLAGELRRGRQLYVVCPLVQEIDKNGPPGDTQIDEAPNLVAPCASGASVGLAGPPPGRPRPGPDWFDVKAAEQTCQVLRQGPFKDFRVGLLHGRMEDSAKDAVMQSFHQGKLDVLVTTVVIEVGVDVPNATLMVIEHADRFGLSQLHQLRGRISRGPVAGECYLFANAESPESRRRLRLFITTTDGFRLAEEDVRIRGVGDFFGTRQHGWGQLHFAKLGSDSDLVQMARDDAFALAAADPGLRRQEHAALRKTVLQRYGGSMELAGIG